MTRLARGAAAALGLALALTPPTSAEETRVIQGMYLSLAATEARGNADSPFARLTAPRDWRLDSSSYSNCSLRFQTRELSGQVLASAQGGPSSGFALSVDQAWVKASFGEGWGLAFGRRELKWKDGGYWNPSDIVNRSLAWNDASASGAGEAQGRDTVEVLGLLPFMDFNLDLSVATALSSGIDDPLDLPLYLAAGSILYPLELRAKAAFQAGRLPMLGAAAKLSLQAGDLYADALWLRDHPIAADFDAASRAEGSWLRYCFGADWTADISASRLASTLSLKAEYLRQDDGLSKGQMKDYFEALLFDDLSTAAGQESYASDAPKWGGRFFSLGRDYLYAGLTLGEIAFLRLSLSCAGVFDLDDGSFALQGGLAWSPRNLVSIRLSASLYGGAAGGEALMLPYSAQYSLSLSRSF